MKLDLKRKLMDVRTGAPLFQKQIRSGQAVDVDLDLQFVAGEALASIMQEDAQLSAAQKLKMGKLVEKIYLESEPDFKTEEVALIKERVGKLYGPLVIAQVEKVIEGQSNG